MAESNGRSTTQVREEIRRERVQLVEALQQLRSESAGLTGRLRAKLPLAIGGALVAALLVAAAIGATMRRFARRGR